MAKITPFLWFDNNAEEAMKFYISIFKNAKILDSGSFELEGQKFMVLNGGPQFKFNEAISMFVSVETQAEVDEYWHKLSEGGQTSQCGWLKDKFGLWWQIVPTALGRLLGDPDREKSKRVLDAMLKMTKLEIDQLQQAYDNA